MRILNKRILSNTATAREPDEDTEQTYSK